MKDSRFGSLFFILLFCSLHIQAFSQTDSLRTDSLSATETTEADTRLITVVGVGDMMLGTNYPSTSYLPANGGKDLLADVEDILKSADITFGNLEGTILDSGGTPKRCNNPDLCYVFRSPESYVEHFSKAGFDFLSLANNHSGDMGAAGRSKTKEVLDEAGIAYAGLAGTDEYALIVKDSITYGLAAFAPNRGTCDIRNISRASAIVKELAEKADIVIVSFHGGAEGAKHQHMTRKTEYYYGEDRGNVYKFAHAMVDAGADVIFGHGPHVTRAMELYKDRFIAYSLGNFCTYGRFNVRGQNGIAPIVKLYLDEEGMFLQGEVIPIYQAKTHGPKIDDSKRVINTLRELNRVDMPDSPLLLTEEGLLMKK
ncbi:MAG: CapA family protein [Bacteroidetes bacterium]|nr:CapA family protein [Bacteroidota bacterium]